MTNNNTYEPRIKITKRVNLITNDDYLAIYKYLESILKGKNEEEIESIRKDLVMDDGHPQALKLRGFTLNGSEINEALSFYRIKKARELGAPWEDMIQHFNIIESPFINDSLLRVIELEAGAVMSSVDLVIEALGDKDFIGAKGEEGRLYPQSVFTRAMEHRLTKHIYMMLDNGATWEELVSIDLTIFNLIDGELEQFAYSEESNKSYEHFLLLTIGFYFSYTDYGIIPLKPSYIVTILEAPREIEFKLKELFEKMISFSDFGGSQYLAKEDGMERAIKRMRGDDVFADNFNKTKVLENLKNEANRN